MLSMLARDWWLFAVRGVAAIVFGVLALVWPGPTLGVLVILFGAYALVDGISLLTALARGDMFARRHAWAVGIMGLVGIVVGIVTFVWPGATALTLLYLVAFWSITVGIFQVAAAIALRREVAGELGMAVGGVLSIVFGALLVAAPGSGLLALVWLVGFWAIAFGISSLGTAHRLRGLGKDLDQLNDSLPTPA